MPHKRRKKSISRLNYLCPSPPHPTPAFDMLCFKGESLLFHFWTSIHVCSVGAGLGKGDNSSGLVMSLRDRTFPGSRCPQGRFCLDPRGSLSNSYAAQWARHPTGCSSKQSLRGIYPKLGRWWCGFSLILHFFTVCKERNSFYKCECLNGNFCLGNGMRDIGLSPSTSSPSIHHRKEITVHQFMPCNDRPVKQNGLCLSFGTLCTTTHFCLLKPGLFLTQPPFLWCEEVWISTVTLASRINQNKYWGENCCIQRHALNCKYIEFSVYE